MQEKRQKLLSNLNNLFNYIVLIEKPQVQSKSWISIGKVYPYIDAVVCRVFDIPHFGSDIEVVYIDGGKTINTGVVWCEEGYWQFANDGPSGGYVDDSSRLSEFVAILRAGRSRF